MDDPKLWGAAAGRSPRKPPADPLSIEVLKKFIKAHRVRKDAQVVVEYRATSEDEYTEVVVTGADVRLDPKGRPSRLVLRCE